MVYNTCAETVSLYAHSVMQTVEHAPQRLLPERASVSRLLPERHPELTNDLPSEWESTDLFPAADPYVTRDVNGDFLCIYQGQLHADRYSLQEISLRRSSTLLGLKDTPVTFLKMDPAFNWAKEVWAPELNYSKEDGMWRIQITFSDGKNENHRMHVFAARSLDEVFMHEKCDLDCENCWTIDATEFEVNGKRLNIASGWSTPDADGTVQNLYARVMNDADIPSDHRFEIAKPDFPWNVGHLPDKGEMRVLEGPQPIVIDGEVVGMTAAAGGSWGDGYCTMIYGLDKSVEPHHPLAWAPYPMPLFAPKFGVGHGQMIHDENRQLYFVGHRQPHPQGGWHHRMAVAIPIDEEWLKEKLDEAVMLRRFVWAGEKYPDLVTKWLGIGNYL